MSDGAAVRDGVVAARVTPSPATEDGDKWGDASVVSGAQFGSELAYQASGCSSALVGVPLRLQDPRVSRRICRAGHVRAGDDDFLYELVTMTSCSSLELSLSLSLSLRATRRGQSLSESSSK